MPLHKPFAMVEQKSKLMAVTLAARAQFATAELESMLKNPDLLKIVLTLRTDSTRVAASTIGRRVASDNVGDTNHLSVFQYRPIKGGWTIINPPEKVLDWNKGSLQSLGFDTAMDLQLLTMVHWGPVRTRQIRYRLD